MSARAGRGAPNPGRGGDGRRLRWSESPVPRVGKRRIRRLGAEPALDPPVALDNGEWEVRRSSTTSAPFTQTDVLDIATGTSWVPDDGEGVIVLMHGVGLGTITIPTGWTLVDQGTAGTIQWLVMFIIGDGSAVDQDVTFSTIAYDDPVAYSYWAFSGAAGWDAAVVDIWSNTGDTVVDLAGDPGTLVAPWSVTIAQYTDNAYTATPTEVVFVQATDPHAGVWVDGYGYMSWWMGIDDTIDAPAVAEAEYTAATTDVDWWAACIGWVPA